MSKKVICPNCGKELELPEELLEYSCLYCGNRSRLPEVAKRAPEAFAAAEADLRGKLVSLVEPYGDSYKKISKKEFFHTFETYENGTRPILRELDACAALHPDGVEAGGKALALTMMDVLDTWMQANPAWESKRRRETFLFETRVTLAIFLCATARKIGLACAEPFCLTLNKEWLRRYPKQPWTPGNYDVMAEGFKKRKWCYITTATCRASGKTDNCPELTSFRSFRDGWMIRNGDEDLIAEYYDKAPAIVACIDLCDDSAARYEEIRARWLTPCYESLREERYADCRALYTDMVRTLEKRYLS